MAPIAIAGADRAAAAAVADAIRRSRDLRAYRFDMAVVGRDLTELSRDDLIDKASRGSVAHDPTEGLDVEFGFRMVESGMNAAIGNGGRIVVIGTTAWDIGAGATREPKAYKDSTRAVMEQMFLPAELAERAILPFAEGYARVGPERHAGVQTVHYRATDAGLRAYAEATGLDGEWTADLWIAVDDGHLIAVAIDGKPFPLPSVSPDASASPGDGSWARERGILVTLEITHVNDPQIVITPPT